MLLGVLMSAVRFRRSQNGFPMKEVKAWDSENITGCQLVISQTPNE